jgi:hypothetical protein
MSCSANTRKPQQPTSSPAPTEACRAASHPGKIRRSSRYVVAVLGMGMAVTPRDHGSVLPVVRPYVLAAFSDSQPEVRPHVLAAFSDSQPDDVRAAP